MLYFHIKGRNITKEKQGNPVLQVKMKQGMKAGIKQKCPTGIRILLGDRKSRILEGITKTQQGLEIGPSHSPCVPKRKGYCVEIVDYLDREGLREHYKGHDVDLDAIEEVDYVWNGGSYLELIQKPGFYDYIIASHLIEHTTDFLGFLQDCSRLLKPDGVLKLAVPDKRYCFDHYRDVTGLSQVLNNAYNPAGLHSPGRVAEYLTNVVRKKEKISWKKPWISWLNRRDGAYTFIHGREEVKETVRRVREEQLYVDIHHYVFTPAAFELLIYDLRILGLTDLKIEKSYGTRGNEFIVALRRTQEKEQEDLRTRKKLLRKRSRQNRI